MENAGEKKRYPVAGQLVEVRFPGSNAWGAAHVSFSEGHPNNVFTAVNPFTGRRDTFRYEAEGESWRWPASGGGEAGAVVQFPPDSPYNPDNLVKATPGELVQLASALERVALERVLPLFRGVLADRPPAGEPVPEHCYDPPAPRIEDCTLDYVVEDYDQPYVLLTIDETAHDRDRTEQVEALRPQLKALGVDAVFVVVLSEPIWVD